MSKYKGLVDKFMPLFANESVDGGLTKTSDQLSYDKKVLIARIMDNTQFVMESGEATVDNVNGAGAFSFPDAPAGNYEDFADLRAGSGDRAVVKLGMAMELAGNTIAFDLLPTIPIREEFIMLEYMDYVYTGGRLDKSKANAPMFVTIYSKELRDATTTVVGTTITTVPTTDGGLSGQFEVMQFDRYNPIGVIVKVKELGTLKDDSPNYTFTPNTTTTIKGVFGAGVTNGFVPTLLVADKINDTTAKVDYTTAKENHIQSASNRGGSNGQPMSREVAEDGVTRSQVGLRTYNKPVQVKSYEMTGAVTRQQARKFKARGMQAVPYVKEAMQNEAMQSINRDILTRMRKLGVTTHLNLYKSQNVNLNLSIEPTAGGVKPLTSFTGEPMIDMKGNDVTSQFGSITNSENNSSAENMFSRQARVRSRILLASTALGYASRFGVADACVVNGQLLSALKESKGYVGSTITNSLTQNVEALYYAGEIAGVKIFCDPDLGWDDFTVTMIRTNKQAGGDEKTKLRQGLVFLPYDLSATVDIIAEGTMAPKFLLESLYALAEVGQHPEKSYLTFKISNGFGSFA